MGHLSLFHKVTHTVLLVVVVHSGVAEVVYRLRMIYKLLSHLFSHFLDLLDDLPFFLFLGAE